MELGIVDIALLDLKIIVALEGGQVVVMTLNVHVDVLIQINTSPFLLRQVTPAPSRRHLTLHLNIIGRCILYRLCNNCFFLTLRVFISLFLMIVAHGLCHYLSA